MLIFLSFKRLVLDEIKQRWSLDDLDVSICMVLSAVLDPHFKPLIFMDEAKMDAVNVELMERIKVLPPAQQCSDQLWLTAAKMLKQLWISYWVRRRVRCLQDL